MQNVYIFLKRASTRFRVYEKVLKKTKGTWARVRGSHFFLNTYLVGPFYKNTYLVGPFYKNTYLVGPFYIIFVYFERGKPLNKRSEDKESILKSYKEWINLKGFY